jgi:hypothetical protein
MDRASRLARHHHVSRRLARLGDDALAERLDQAGAGRASIGGTTLTLDLDGVPVFVKQLALTELERRPEHLHSTANLFQLPTFYQYAVGSAGFGAWRELAAHSMTTAWVLGDEHPSFPILHHWRVVERPPRPAAPTDREELERSVAFWEGSPAVRARLEAMARSGASLVLFMEPIPHTVRDWLGARVAEGGVGAAAACQRVEERLAAALAFMNARGLLHLDAHIGNLLTDGEEVFLADFGLALGADFELGAEEATFFREHLGYDRAYATTFLVRWLLTALGTTAAERDWILRRAAEGDTGAELPAYAAELVRRHAPVAVVLSDFLRALHTGSKRTPYPAALRDLSTR